MINKKSKIYLAGHRGMVGSAILDLLKKKNFKNLITRTKEQLNLQDQTKTFNFLMKYKPEIVIIAAAKVGGIKANNTKRAEFIYENAQIQNNLIHGSYMAGVKKLIFLGSSCIYPRDCKQPIKEKYILNGKLEYTNEPYAIAKILGVKMIENYNTQYGTDYLCLMPCNLYGPNDNYDLDNSHFLPAMIRKLHEAKINNKKTVTFWGNGKPKRELMHVDDLADACLHFLNIKTKECLINVGSAQEYTIKKFSRIISKNLGYSGKIIFNKNKLNGTTRKILDSSLARKYGWKANLIFEEKIDSIYRDFKNSFKKKIT